MFNIMIGSIMKHGINFFHYRIVGNFLTLNQNHPNEAQDSSVLSTCLMCTKL